MMTMQKNFFTYAKNPSSAEESTDAAIVTFVSPTINNYKYIVLIMFFQLHTRVYKIF